MGNEAAEKTEEATPRRRQKEREKGNVSKSKDFESALVMAGAIALLAMLSKYMFNTILNMMRDTFSTLGNFDTSNTIGMMYPYFKYYGLIVLPFFVLLVIKAKIRYTERVSFRRIKIWIIKIIIEIKTVMSISALCAGGRKAQPAN